MMILKSSPPSPFGRKVKIAAGMLGLSDTFEIVTTDTLDPDDPIRGDNPLGKIPALILDDGTVLYDSRVILEYFDHLADGGKIIPKQAPARFKALTLQALADGLTDAGILRVYEGRFRSAEKHEPKWLGHQTDKMTRALVALEAAPPTGPRTVADIALACALGYLDFRFDGAWRGTYPKLVAWLAAFAAEVPAFETTRFKG